MLIVQEKLVKLGGVKLSGQVKSIDITEAATIENIEDDKGKTKANQPTGYEAAKITIEFVLEDTKTMTQEEQIVAMQQLFHPYGQKKAKLLQVTNDDCAVRGISKVYFQQLSTKNVIAESGRTATLELLAPVIGKIRLKKKMASIGPLQTGTISSVKPKSKKSMDKSPAKKKKKLVSVKKHARRLIK